MQTYTKMRSRKYPDVVMKVIPGHFVTTNAHINYIIDMTTMKTRQNEAKAAAKAIASTYMSTTIVDTIVCMDGMEVIGAYLADELTQAGIMSMNAHQTIYVYSPEFDNQGQMIFRENSDDLQREFEDDDQGQTCASAHCFRDDRNDDPARRREYQLLRRQYCRYHSDLLCSEQGPRTGYPRTVPDIGSSGLPRLSGGELQDVQESRTDRCHLQQLRVFRVELTGTRQLNFRHRGDHTMPESPCGVDSDRTGRYSVCCRIGNIERGKSEETVIH